MFGNYPQFTSGGFFPWDVFPITYLTDPELFSIPVPYQAEIRGEKCHFEPSSLGNCRVPLLLLDPERFLDLLVDRLCSVVEVTQRR